jgi:hypothetical protein
LRWRLLLFELLALCGIGVRWLLQLKLFVVAWRHEM